jgi:oligopeptide transport system substrate-binding protein
MKKDLSRSIVLILVIALLVNLLTACAPVNTEQPVVDKTKETDEPSRNEGSDEPVVLRVPFGYEPSSLDTGFGNSSDSIAPRGMMFDGLVRIFDNKIEPALAESWDVSDDGLTYTFHLRDSKWADGQPVTAHDFVYGITRLLDPSDDAPNGNYAWMGYYLKNGKEFNSGECDASELGVKAIDEKTLELTAAKVMPYFIDLLKMPTFYPVRQDYAEKYGKEYASSPDKVMCNGPFVLKEWNHESSLIFEKNPYHYNADNINVDIVEAYIIAETQTVLNMFDSGEMDMIYFMPKEFIPKYVETGEAVKVDGATVWFTVINSKSDRGEATKLLQNKNFRKAFSYALDRQQLVDVARGDGSIPITRICPDLMTILDTTLGERYPYNPYEFSADPDNAQKYFELALKETGMERGKIPTLKLLIHEEDTAKITAEILQSVMKTNFNISLEIDTQTYKGRVEKENNGDYDLCITNWAPDYNDPMTFLECYESTNSYNMYFGGYNNPEYDELIKFANETTDMEKRADALFEAEEMFIEDMVCVPMFQTSSYWAKKTHIDGITRCGFGAVDPDISRVYVNPIK